MSVKQARINVERNGGHLCIPADVYTLDGFRRWAHSPQFPERGRISFIKGEVDVDMSPEEIQTHNKLKTAISGGLFTIVERADLGELHFDGAFFVNKRAALATEPDAMFCSWEGLVSKRVRYREWTKGSNRLMEIAGSPDIVVEIISYTSVRKDTKRLPRQYFAAGVAEYWLIDGRESEIDFKLLARGKTRYAPVQPDADGFVHSAVLGRRLKLERKRNRAGGFSYKLLDREPA